MIDAGFIRDFKKNYLVVEDKRVLNDSYETKMITENDVPGLLKSSQRMIDGRGYLYYDITSKHAFYTLYEDRKIGMDVIRILFSCLYDTCEDMENYMLYDDGLILDPKYVYKDMDSDKYLFLYYKDEDSNETFNALLYYILDRLDTDDTVAVEAIYRMTDAMDQSGCVPSEMIRWFLEEYSETGKEILPVAETEDESDLTDWIKNENEIATKESWWTGFIKRLFSGKKAHTSDTYDNYNYERECAFFDNAEDTVNNKTMFIPWIESSQNVLYGEGKNNKIHIDLTKAPIRVGKFPKDVDVVLDDESISRLHVKFSRQGVRYYMTDLNSTNGSFKNGMRIDPNQSVLIEPGDEIGLGRLKFIYR